MEGFYAVCKKNMNNVTLKVAGNSSSMNMARITDKIDIAISCFNMHMLSSLINVVYKTCILVD